QLAFKELRGKLHRIIKGCTLRFTFFHFRITGGHRNPGHVGYTFNCFWKACAFQICQKFKMITRHPTAKAMVAPLAIFTVKACGIFTMKRTASPEVTSARIALFTIKRNACSDQCGNRHTISKLIEKRGWETHSMSLSIKTGELQMSIMRSIATLAPALSF